ncbi:CPCC family cysteine-rich protein [Muribacter muris]|nr:CPCC family cysteine-rich protein [Muribacter muris]
MMKKGKYLCPCCMNYALSTEREYEVCSICGWEDDPVQFDDPDFYGGANQMSLNDARKCFEEYTNINCKKIKA